MTDIGIPERYTKDWRDRLEFQDYLTYYRSTPNQVHGIVCRDGKPTFWAKARYPGETWYHVGATGRPNEQKTLDTICYFEHRGLLVRVGFLTLVTDRDLPGIRDEIDLFLASELL